MARKKTEWSSQNHDAKVPPEVQLRIWKRENGICHITGEEIGKREWDLDHVLALADGGLHIESNLKPALRTAHMVKTVEENKQRAKTKRLEKTAAGISKRKAPIGGGPPKEKKPSKWANMPNIPRKSLYTESE